MIKFKDMIPESVQSTTTFLDVLKCPECKAPVQVDPGQKRVFCRYCGAQINIKQQQSETEQQQNDMYILAQIAHLKQQMKDEEENYKLKKKKWPPKKIADCKYEFYQPFDVIFNAAVHGVHSVSRNVTNMNKNAGIIQFTTNSIWGTNKTITLSINCNGDENCIVTIMDQNSPKTTRQEIEIADDIFKYVSKMVVLG